jgi:ssRNA-specific RNase YbeY (16S rRNA maturation enzyme)
VRRSAADFKSAFEEEIRRVMVHGGVLHYCGYKDKGEYCDAFQGK